MAVADWPVGFGGAACDVVADAVTPLETAGVASLFTEHTRNEYWVEDVSPVTEWLVPTIAPAGITVPAEHDAGALAPLWYAIL